MGMDSNGWTYTEGPTPGPTYAPSEATSASPSNQGGEPERPGGSSFGGGGPPGDISLGGAIFMLAFVGLLICLLFNVGEIRTKVATSLAEAIPKRDTRTQQDKMRDEILAENREIERKLLASKSDPIRNHDDQLSYYLLPGNSRRTYGIDPLEEYQRWGWKQRLACAGVSPCVDPKTGKASWEIRHLEADLHFLPYFAFAVSTFEASKLRMSRDHFERWQEMRALVEKALEEGLFDPSKYSEKDLEDCRLEIFKAIRFSPRPERDNEWRSDVFCAREIEAFRSDYAHFSAHVERARLERRKSDGRKKE